MRKLKSVSITRRFDVDAKNLMKGDRVFLGSRTYKIATNRKSEYKARRIVHLVWGSGKKKDEIILIVPKNMKFSVSRTDLTVNDR